MEDDGRMMPIAGFFWKDELVFLKLLWATWGLLTSPHFEDVG
jgi:hypothetical protein